MNPIRNNSSTGGPMIAQISAVRSQAMCMKIAMNDDHIVYVYLQAREQEALDKFLASKDLKDAMKAAGVKDTPEITKLTEEESRDY